MYYILIALIVFTITVGLYRFIRDDSALPDRYSKHQDGSVLN